MSDTTLITLVYAGIPVALGLLLILLGGYAMLRKRPPRIYGNYKNASHWALTRILAGSSFGLGGIGVALIRSNLGATIGWLCIGAALVLIATDLDLHFGLETNRH